MATDTTLQASNPLRFRNFCFNLIKITVIDQIKILDDNIKSNPVQYDLGREAVDISTL